MPDDPKVLVGFPMGTRQSSWRLAANAWWNKASFTTEFGGYAYRTTLPPTSFLLGNQRALIGGLTGYNNIAFKFFGYMPDDDEEPVSAEGKTGRIRIWGFNPFKPSPSATHYFGDGFAELRFTMGATTAGAGNLLPTPTDGTSVYLADAVTILSDKSLFPGVRVVTDEAGGWAQVILDGIACTAFVIELAQGVTDPADKVGALYRLF